MDSALTLRFPRLIDQEQVRTAHAELMFEGFQFAFHWHASRRFAEWIRVVDANARGAMLPPGWVSNDFLLALIGDVVVGRVSIRNELNEFLRHEGGHIGYAVRPAFRRRGHATEILRQSVRILGSRGVARVLVTCDAANTGSAAVIEACGGTFEDTRLRSDGQTPVRRYWINASS